MPPFWSTVPRPQILPSLMIGLKGSKFHCSQVAGIDGVDVGVEGDHARALADPADDVAQAVNANLVEADLLHLLLDDGDDLLLLGGEGRGADQVGEEADGVFFAAPWRVSEWS